ncbi:MAG: hypothetical protein ACJA1N_000404 [Saprospiraceae bacterium]|jgi:hypothetical protein
MFKISSSMRKLFTKIFMLILTISLSSVAFGQTIDLVVVSANPTNCSNTAVTVDATQLCINHIYNGMSSSTTGNIITVILDWSTPGPICLGALAFISGTENLGNVASGTYILNVETYLDGTVQNSSTQQLIVASCCPVQSVVQGPNNICTGESMTLYNNSTNATSSYWTLNGVNISTSDSLPIIAPAVGSYLYQLVSTDGNCTDSVSHSLTVNNYPTVDLGLDTSVCVGQSVMLNGSTSGATGYQWSTGTTSSTLTVTGAGTYSVVVSINGCTSTDAIVVGSVPTPVFTLPTSAAVCEGIPVVLDGTVNDPNVTYTWSNGAITPMITVTTSGTYNLTTTNSFNCAHSDGTIIVIESLPIPNLGGDTTLCEGETLQLNGSIAGIANYSWSTGATTAGLLVDTAGTYIVTLTSDNGCVGTDNIVIDYSVIEFDWGTGLDIAISNPLTLDAGNTGSTYLWNTGETTQTISTDSAGTYTVTVTTAFDCTEGSSVVVVNSTGTKNQLEDKVKVFPNPAQNFLVVEHNSLNLQRAIITNAYGQIVNQVTIQNNNKISVADLASGFYFIQFQDKNGELVGTTRFIKQ